MFNFKTNLNTSFQSNFVQIEFGIISTNDEKIVWLPDVIPHTRTSYNGNFLFRAK